MKRIKDGATILYLLILLCCIFIFGYPAYQYYSSIESEAEVLSIVDNEVLLSVDMGCPQRVEVQIQSKDHFIRYAHEGDKVAIYYLSCRSDWLYVPKFYGNSTDFLGVILTLLALFNLIYHVFHKETA